MQGHVGNKVAADIPLETLFLTYSSIQCFRDQSSISSLVGTRPGVCGQLGSSLPRPREPCTSGIISHVITCLTRRLRGFNEIMFVKLFELLGRINGTIEMQNIIIIVITEAFTLVPDEEEKP